jgi:hypothetical protein
MRLHSIAYIVELEQLIISMKTHQKRLIACVMLQKTKMNTAVAFRRAAVAALFIVLLACCPIASQGQALKKGSPDCRAVCSGKSGAAGPCVTSRNTGECCCSNTGGKFSAAVLIIRFAAGQAQLLNLMVSQQSIMCLG